MTIYTSVATTHFLTDMPAKTMLFDKRVRTVHDFGMAPHNYISFNPQGRLIALAGFGNLAGKIDIFDRRSLNKVCTIDAPNTSFCDWSPDGRFLLTATLSPRLRVDNGIKIWHCSGPLIHVQPLDELYHTAWRPTPPDNGPQFGNAIPPAPAPSDSVKEYTALQKPVAAKPAGAYRPPGARGLATPSIFKREDEGGPGTYSGSATPPRYNRSPAPGSTGYLLQQNGNVDGDSYLQNSGRRHVPGAPASASPSPAPDGSRNRRKKKKQQRQDGAGTGATTPGEDVASDAVTSHGAHVQGKKNAASKNVPNGDQQDGVLIILPVSPTLSAANSEGAAQTPVTSTMDGAVLDPIAKKARNLNKKVRFHLTMAGLVGN